MQKQLTPIENRAAWKLHHEAADAARARGADFHEAQEAGFRATENLVPTERERLSIMLGSGRVPLLPGDSPGLWFVRVRKVLETALFNPRVALGSKDREGAPS